MKCSKFGWSSSSWTLECESCLGNLLKVLAPGSYLQMLIQQVLGGFRNLFQSGGPGNADAGPGADLESSEVSG